MKNFFVKQIVVVIFIITGLAVLMGVTLVMGKNRMTVFQSVIVYKSIFKNTRGIYTGSEVTVHGVRTGNVIETTLLKDGSVEVSFTTLKKHAFAVNKSSTTRLKTLGMLGDRYVDISTPDLKAGSLKEGAFIPSRPSAVDIVDLLSGTGGGGKSESLKELKLSATNLMDFSKSVLKDLSETADRVNGILKKIEKGEGTLGALINNRDLYNRILTLLGEKPRHKYMKELYKKPSGKSKTDKKTK